MVRLVRNAIALTFVIEAAGAVILSLRLIPEFGFARDCTTPFLWLYPDSATRASMCWEANSIERFVADPVINLVLMALITIGGLGFSVLVDLGKTVDSAN